MGRLAQKGLLSPCGHRTRRWLAFPGMTFDSVSLGTGRHKVKGIAAAIGLPSDVTLVEEDIEVEIQITEDGSGGADSGSSGWTGENGEDGE